MIPYADFLYFGVLLYVVVPTVLLGLAGRASRAWILIATAAMLLVQYGGSLRVLPGAEIREIWIVAGYAVFEWAVAWSFLRVRARSNSRWPFRVALLLALLPLLVAKYAALIAPHFQLGFLGISYVTLRALDVVFCIQDRLITALPPSQFVAFLFFFATISSGPIDRSRRFEKDWTHRRTRAELLADLDGAVERLFRGFLYKFILAALVKRYWLDPAAAQAGALATISYMYAYSAYLFFDFAGYSAFAIAVSYLFGIHTPENFDRPFLARNIRDFWNRWNVTLSWWLRDHVYMRFVMAATKGRWFERRYLASYLGLFLAFGLMGLWHGPTANYLLYGLYHGALLSAHEAFARWNKRRQVWGDGRLGRAAAIAATFQCVCFGFLLFSGRLTGDVAAQLPADAGAHTYEGRHEKASCAEIGGWAWDAHAPKLPIDVDILIDGVHTDTVTADLARPDLAAAGTGTGDYGFVYVPPSRVKDGVPHTVEVRIAGTDIALSDTGRSIVCDLSAESMDGREGAVESADCNQIRGWAWDSTQPDSAVRVDVYAGTTLIATVVADQGHASHGGHGFVFNLFEPLWDGQPHVLSVRIAGTNIGVRNSPLLLTCSGPLAPGPSSPLAPTAPPAAGAATPGPPPSYADNGDGTVSASHTHLMWEKKVKLDGGRDAANPHDADNCYPWFGSCATGSGDCRVDADCGANGPCNADDCQSSAPGGLTIFKWVQRLNASNFAGHDDWRIPTSTELYSVVNPLEAKEPAAVAAFEGQSCGAGCPDLSDPACSCTHRGLYWAAPEAAPKPDDSWMMFFYCNGHLFLDLKSNRFQVRAVRDDPGNAGGPPP